MTVFQAGTRLGKYEIVGVLGTGGMGILYEARHPVLANRLVIKTMRAALQRDGPDMAERFRNEALAASRVRDDRLPQIFDIDELEDGTQYIVMELLTGEDLSQRLSRGALTSGYACRIVLEVLEVLSKVHRLGIVHRDIKPANVFLARSDMFGEIPKLLDFGVAHIATMGMTQGHQRLGTPAYMAPEQALGEPIGPGADVFSAGVMLFELIAGLGQRPWMHENAAAYYRALAMNEMPRSLGSVIHVPAGLSTVIERALSRSPTDRYPDATAFARALEPYADDRGSLYRHGQAERGSVAGRPADVTARGRDPRAHAPTAKIGGSGRSHEETVVAGPAQSAPSVVAPPPTRAHEPQVSGLKIAELRRQMDRIRLSSQRSARVEAAPAVKLKRGERRHVTVVFIELQLFQTGPAALSTEDREQISSQFTSMLADELRERGAQVDVQSEAALLAVFGFAEVREDDPERAVAAAFAIHRRRAETNDALAEIGYTLTCRAGVHRGFATRVDDAREAPPLTGEVLTTARKLAEHAPINGIVGSGDVISVVGESFSTRLAGRITIKGRAEPAIEMHEILGVASVGWEDSPGGHTLWPTEHPASSPRPHTESSWGIRFRSNTAFVGRQAELARLLEIAAEAQSPGRTVTIVHITGAAGTGKTRLVSELLRCFVDASHRVPNVLRAQPQAGTTYGLWTALIGALLSRGPDPLASYDDLHDAMIMLCAALPNELRDEAPIHAPALRLLFGLPGAALEGDESPTAIGERIAAVVTLCLEAATRRAAPEPDDPPLVIALENLHRADHASLELLSKVLSSVRAPSPPLVILTARDAGAVDTSRLPGASVITLGPLDEPSVETLATQLAGHPLLEAVREFVVHRAAGNPLFVEELMHTLRVHSLLSASADRLRTFTPPTSLYGMLLERVDNLPRALRETLRLASVLGVELERALFLSVAADAATMMDQASAAERPEEALDELVRLGFLEATQSMDGTVLHAFRPAQLQGAVYGTVLVENKRILHRLAADALEQLYRDRIGPHLSRLLFHASQTDDVRRALEYARAAGHRALELCAYAEAVEHLEIAVALQGQTNEANALPPARTLFELASAYVWSGKIRLAAVRGREAAERIAAALQTISLSDAARCDLHTLEAKVANVRAQVAYLLADMSFAVALREQAEHAFTAAGFHVDAAAARCGRGFMLRTLGRPDLGLQLAQEGWAILKDSQHLATIAHAGHDLGNVLRDAGKPEESIEIFDRAIAAGEELRRRGASLDSVWGRLGARSGRAMAYAMMGRTDEAIADQRAVRDLAIRESQPVPLAVSEYHLAAHFAERGDLDEAERMLGSSLRMSTEMGMASRALKCLLLQAKISERRGDDDAALAALVEAEELARGESLSDDLWMGAAELLVVALRRAGLTERAKAIVGEAQNRAKLSQSEKLLRRVDAIAQHD